MFLNGVEDHVTTSCTVTDTLSSNSTEVWLGAREYSGSVDAPFDGYLDDTRIYNRALGNGEVAFLYDNSLGIDPGTENLSALWSFDDLGDGLVVHYEMNESDIGTSFGSNLSSTTVSDSIGGFDGTTSGGASRIPGKFGEAMDFDDVDGAINLGDNLFDGYEDFTVSTWANFDGSGDIISKWHTGTTFLFQYQSAPNSYISAGFNPSTGNYFTVRSDTNSITSGWHQVAVRRQGADIEFYIDGKQNNTNANTNTALAGALVDSTANTSFGARLDNNSSYFGGSLDELRVYTRALSNGEIAYLYDGSGVNPSTNGLEAYYSFDAVDASPEEIHDESKGGHTGLVTGATRVNGIKAEAMDFDGTNDYIDLGMIDNSDALSLYGNDVTISFWGNFDTSGNEWSRIIEKATDPSGENGYLLIYNDATDLLNFHIGGSSAVFTTPLPDSYEGAWNHYLIRYQNGGGKGTVFANNTIIDSTIDNPVSFTNESAGVKIGGNWDNNSTYSLGAQLDDFRVYNKYLSNGEVAFLYNGSGSVANTENLVLMYSFDDEDSQLVKDSSGNDLHGKGHGGVQYAEGTLRR